MTLFRPFELLKFIRDGLITNTRDMPFFQPSSREYSLYKNFLRGLQELGLINISNEREIATTKNFTLLLDTLDISLTQLEHFSRNSMICTPLFGLPSIKHEKSDIFMVMPFLDKLKPVYDDHIRNVAKGLSLTIARGDDFFTTQSIISDIWNAINSCKIVIADCTGRNPNVFYEIGIAHTLGKPVIFISQNKDDIPFDIQHIRYIIYEFTPRGMDEFEKKLISTMEHVLRELNYDNDKLRLEKK